jgi:hypothetical protein
MLENRKHTDCSLYLKSCPEPRVKTNGSPLGMLLSNSVPSSNLPFK